MRISRLPQKPEQTVAAFQENIESSTAQIPAIDLHEVLRILFRQKKAIFATIVGILLLALLVTSSLSPRYTAAASVEIDARQAQVVNFDAVLTGLSGDSENILTEIAIIQSRQLALRVVERMKFNLDPEFNATLRSAGLLKSWGESLMDWLGLRDEETQEPSSAAGAPDAEAPQGFLAGLKRNMSDYLSPVALKARSKEKQVAAENNLIIDSFLKHLSVSSQKRSRVVEISFESESPETAAEAVNTIADFYIVAQLEAKFEATKRATTWLNERVEQLRKEVVAKERAIEKYRAEFGLLRGGQDATLASETVSEMNAQYVLELARLAEAQARLRQANELLKSQNGIESVFEVLQSPLIRELRAQESLLERDIAELSENYGARHPTYINRWAELRDLQTRISLEVDRIFQGLRNEVAVARARSSSLKTSLDKLKQEIAGLNQSAVQLRALELDAGATRTLLETLLERTKQTASQESFQQADANIISYAAEPTSPSFPRTGLIMSLVFVLALVQAVPLAFALENLDLGFRSTEQASRLLGVRSLGFVPKISKLSAMGKAPHQYILENPKSAFAESIRSLYTNVLLTDVVHRPKIILMTSAMPSEGKTVVTLSLARALASVGHRVIVVDCDLRRPSVHSGVGIEAGPGLLDCLNAGANVDDLILEDAESGAHILRAGSPVHNSPELLDSERTQQILRHLGRTYDLVLLDSAPLLAVSDTLFLARLADKTIFLVRWGKTRRNAAGLALKQMLAAQGDVAGALLTMVDLKSHASYGDGASDVYRGDLKKYYTG